MPSSRSILKSRRSARQSGAASPIKADPNTAPRTAERHHMANPTIPSQKSWISQKAISPSTEILRSLQKDHLINGDTWDPYFYTLLPEKLNPEPDQTSYDGGKSPDDFRTTKPTVHHHLMPCFLIHPLIRYPQFPSKEGHSQVTDSFPAELSYIVVVMPSTCPV